MDFQILNRLFKNSIEYNHHKIRSKDLTDTEYMICSVIFYNDACSQEDVVKALRIDKTTVGKALQKLETKGYISRQQDQLDKRKKLLTVTEKGKKQISGVMDLHDKWLENIMTCLSDDEQKQFEDYCRRLLDAAELLAKNQLQKSN